MKNGDVNKTTSCNCLADFHTNSVQHADCLWSVPLLSVHFLSLPGKSYSFFEGQVKCLFIFRAFSKCPELTTSSLGP